MHEHKEGDLREPWGAAGCYGIVSWGWHCLGVRSICSALLFLYTPILLIRALLCAVHGTAVAKTPSPCHDFCDFLPQPLALHPVTLQVHSILLSAHVETIASVFTQHYFLQACWSQRQEKLATILTSKSLRGRTQTFGEDQGDLGFR